MDATSRTTVTALILYSEKDQGFRSRFEAYMSLLERDHYVDTHEFLAVEEIKRTEEESLSDKADVFLFVVTTSLVVSDFCGGETFKKMKAMHHIGQRLVVPMLYRKTETYEKAFSRIAPIPTNGKPVMDKHWPSIEEALHEIYSGLKTMCFEFRKAKDQLERSWETAQRQHNVNAYRHFLKQHPHSRYESQALANVQQLTEEELWQNALKSRSVDAYYNYLTDSPLKSRRFEAADAIDRLEKDSERNWQEILAKDKLVLYMDYYLRSPGGKHAREARQKIEERLREPLVSMRGQDLQTQQNSLELMAYNQLQAPEIFTMNTYARYGDQVKRRLVNLLRRRQSNETLHAVFLFLAGLLEIWLFNRYYQPSIDQYGFFDTPNTRLLQLGLVIMLNAWLLFRAYIYFGNLQRDIQFLKRAYYIMQSLTVLLKVAFLARDQDSKDTIVKFYTRIDQRTGEIERKTTLTYLLQSGHHEPEVLLSVEKMVK